MNNYIDFMPNNNNNNDNDIDFIDDKKNKINLKINFTNLTDILNIIGLKEISEQQNNIFILGYDDLKYLFSQIKLNYQKINKNEIILIKKRIIIDIYDKIIENFTNKNYLMMVKYLRIGLELRDIECIKKLARYYCQIEKNYDLMKIYYTKAIKLGCVESMYELANYYYYVENNYTFSKQYYLEATKHGCVKSMYELAIYYSQVELDFNNMKLYFIKASQLGCIKSMYELGIYFYQIEKDYKKAIYYLTLGTNFGSKLCYDKLYKLLENLISNNIPLPNKITE
jgi:hypothetical protein